VAGRSIQSLGRITTDMPTVTRLIETVTAWASARDGIIGLALVGSHARNAAKAESDVDFVLITPDPNRFRESFAWLNEIDWASLGVSVGSSRDARYGAVWSRHVQLSNGLSVELSFANPSWAATSPCDPGTRAVLSRGCRVLFDPQQLLQNVVSCAA
jgi:uncharacterized protein